MLYKLCFWRLITIEGLRRHLELLLAYFFDFCQMAVIRPVRLPRDIDIRNEILTQLLATVSQLHQVKYHEVMEIGAVMKEECCI